MQPVYFATPAAFRAWLTLHSGNGEFLWVGYYKAGCGKASVTWPESVEEALWFGWIDGRRQRIDVLGAVRVSKASKGGAEFKAVDDASALSDGYRNIPRSSA